MNATITTTDGPWVVYPTTTDNPEPQLTKKIKRVTRTIEKWDARGEYLGKEVIIEDAEDVEIPDYTWHPDGDKYIVTWYNSTLVSNTQN